MKSFFERLKDLIYESMDYLLIIAIIIGVVSLIGWRLDILFDADKTDNSTPPIVADDTDLDDIDDVANNDGDVEPDSQTDEDEDPSDEEAPNQEPDEEAPDTDTPSDDSDGDAPDTDTPVSTQDTVTIVIPDGTLPSGIGTILETNGLIDSKNEFVMRAQSMDLDRKLRSGTYEIQNNSSLDEVIKIIARQS